MHDQLSHIAFSLLQEMAERNFTTKGTVLSTKIFHHVSMGNQSEKQAN